MSTIDHIPKMTPDEWANLKRSDPVKFRAYVLALEACSNEIMKAMGGPGPGPVSVSVSVSVSVD
jgi:hypothetical protein